MRKFSKNELKHLKFKLINEEGLTPQEVQDRVKAMVEYQYGLDKKKRKNG